VVLVGGAVGVFRVNLLLGHGAFGVGLVSSFPRMRESSVSDFTAISRRRRE
jgi:hypothetical protein